MKKINNNSGAVLIIACIGLFMVLMLTAGFALSLVSELGNARRFCDTTASFWLAQAGISRFLRNPGMLDDRADETFSLGSGTVNITKYDSPQNKRVITSTGLSGGSERTIQIEFPAKHPEVFENSISAHGDISVAGQRSAIAFNDKMRLNGKLINNAKYSSIFTEDKEEGAGPGRVAVSYPDLNQNGQANEFADFVAYNRELLARYPKEEIVYIKGNRTYTLTPKSELSDKKIIYVEGDEGKGDVVIQFSGPWGDRQDVTVISTGTVTFNQGGLQAPDSQLNIMAWSGYKETAVIPSVHYGMILTQGKAEFDEIYDTSITNGCIIANAGISFGEVWSTKTFNYADLSRDGRLPIGFEGLIGLRNAGYLSAPDIWKEI